jgi:hypothetical protein
MKGVVVQVGDPKSIVLFNNGKIMAIPTPAGCRLGMVVSVKYNYPLKIIIFTLAAILLISVGIFIGAMFLGRSGEAASGAPPPGQRGYMMERYMMERERRMNNPGGDSPDMPRRGYRGGRRMMGQ